MFVIHKQYQERYTNFNNNSGLTISVKSHILNQCELVFYLSAGAGDK